MIETVTFIIFVIASIVFIVSFFITLIYGFMYLVNYNQLTYAVLLEDKALYKRVVFTIRSLLRVTKGNEKYGNLPDIVERRLKIVLISFVICGLSFAVASYIN